MLELKCEEKFSMGSAYNYSKEIEKTILDSLPGWIKAKCSVLKIIRTVCNLAKINPLECCLLAWLLAKSKYDIEKISTDSKTKIVEDEFDQKVLLFVLMNAYYVKEFICERIQPEIDLHITNQIHNFKHLYTKKFNPEKSLKTLSLGDINKIFNEWTCKQNKTAKIDYNSLVDKILYLSKSYNVVPHEDQTKEEKQGAPRKRRKLNNIPHQNDKKSEVESQNEPKSQSMKQFQTEKPKQGSYRFTHSPQHPDFLGPSQDQPLPSYKPPIQHIDMGQSKRTTRNMLQSINIYDFIPSQDNLFHSQFSSLSNNNLMGSQSWKNDQVVEQSLGRRSSLDRERRSGEAERRERRSGEAERRSGEAEKKEIGRGTSNGKEGMVLKRTDSFDGV